MCDPGANRPCLSALRSAMYSICPGPSSRNSSRVLPFAGAPYAAMRVPRTVDPPAAVSGHLEPRCARGESLECLVAVEARQERPIVRTRADQSPGQPSATIRWSCEEYPPCHVASSVEAQAAVQAIQRAGLPSSVAETILWTGLRRHRGGRLQVLLRLPGWRMNMYLIDTRAAAFVVYPRTCQAGVGRPP